MTMAPPQQSSLTKQEPQLPTQSILQEPQLRLLLIQMENPLLLLMTPPELKLIHTKKSQLPLMMAPQSQHQQTLMEAPLLQLLPQQESPLLQLLLMTVPFQKFTLMMTPHTLLLQIPQVKLLLEALLPQMAHIQQ